MPPKNGLQATHRSRRAPASATSLPVPGDAVDARLERNKRTAKDFYDLMFNQSRLREAIKKYAWASYTQHNPHVADGKETLIAHFFEHRDLLLVVPGTLANGNKMF